jgi:hypothetical protein
VDQQDPSGEDVAVADLHRVESPVAEPPSKPELPLWCSLVVSGAVFAALLAWSWARWTDAHIDFGAELYIPWRISEGDILYRDIAYRHGPLSHNLNALFFRSFGVSLRTLVLCNLVILIGISGLIFRFFERALGRSEATGVCCSFLVLFGFSQYAGISNFNYVTPYLHAQTHGLALSLGSLLLLLEGWERRSRLRMAAAGLCFGGVLLTKAELAVPAAAAAGCVFLLMALSDAADRRAAATGALGFLGAALVPGAAFYACFQALMPADLALAGVLGNWSALGGEVLSDPYYRRGAGLDDPAGNLRRAGVAFAGVAAAVVLAVLADQAFRVRRGRRVLAAAAGLAVLAILVARPAAVSWKEVARALPFTTLLIGAFAAAACLRRRGERAALLHSAAPAVWSIFALGLLGKMLLNARLSHYGFVLAMPATLLLIGFLAGWLPALLQRRSGRGELLRALALGAIVAASVFFWRESDRHYRIKNFGFGQGADAMLVEDPRIQARGRDLAAALDILRASMPPEATLLVLPDGVGLNYWLRRVNPTRYTLFLPPEFADLGGERAMLADLRANAPDFVVLVHRNHEEFGVGPFGADPRNGRAIMQWVEADYQRIERIGEEPFQGRGFGIVILRRVAGAAGAASLR